MPTSAQFNKNDIPLMNTPNAFSKLNTFAQFKENAVDLGNVSGATAVDLTLGNVFKAKAVGPVTWQFFNPAPAGAASTVILILDNGGGWAQVWPITTKWPNSIDPVLTNPGTDILVFKTRDGGVTWYGTTAGLNFM